MPWRQAAAISWFVLFLGMGPAKADRIELFKVSGIFENGSLLSGTILIDIANGEVRDVDLRTSSPSADRYTWYSFGYYSAYFGGFWMQIAETEKNSVPQINLLVDTLSLIDYAGGDLFSQDKTSPQGYRSDLTTSADVFRLTSGSLSMVPLPTSILLFGCALLAVGTLRRTAQASLKLEKRQAKLIGAVKSSA